MSVYFRILAIVISALTETCAVAAQENGLTKGITLYNQLKIDSAIAELKKEAQSGISESQYYLGEALRKRNRYMTSEAKEWYEAAAAQENLYAMIQLGRSGNDLCRVMSNCPDSGKPPVDWLKNARSLAELLAEKGDPEAMYVMYEITLNRDWLEKSANSGNPTAQFWMAISTRQGEGFFLPWKRKESVGNWFKASAEGGNPRAMMEYAAYIHESGGDLEVARHWIKVAAEKGYESGVTSYGAYLAHAPERFGFELDLVKGYALTSLLKELNEGGSMQSYVEEVLPEIAEKMTPDQIKEAENFAAQWKNSHPPLSFFPDKLSR
ncbi:tetratricopeptide repeat protein [Pseudomonas sp. 13B_3.2_Bac1]|uniref:tetratricopeptide repeat protein n=1 Tax=Pseudomonas sp. 13B_3.2_Bac1 TaxID=2971623 RepID=UPI0021C58F05|nr:sel1 repeat family protein [Pseudomonas sp. 13B_3.2_Bac1]MCU1771305.1 sel1 repeat family protein [Pseudomonas sp. 13B_3.2_Bac1]